MVKIQKKSSDHEAIEDTKEDIYLNLQRLNKLQKLFFTEEDIYKVVNSRFGWY